MAKVLCIAIEKGYDGVQIREVGAQFEMDESVFDVRLPKRNDKGEIVRDREGKAVTVPKLNDDGSVYQPTWFRRAKAKRVQQVEYEPEGRERGNPVASHAELAAAGANLV